MNWTRLGASDIFDYTQPVMDIVDSVQNHANISLCCQYQLQLLDKFCARQTAVGCVQSQSVALYLLLVCLCVCLLKQVNLDGTCSASDDFGYKYCPECLL